jgi:hypothetical protein
VLPFLFIWLSTVTFKLLPPDFFQTETKTGNVPEMTRLTLGVLIHVAELKKGTQRKIHCVVLGNSETPHPSSFATASLHPCHSRATKRGTKLIN